MKDNKFNNKINHKAIINKQIFDQEIALCKILAKQNNGKSGWGICEKCGVLPLLLKLHKGVLLEDQVEISNARNILKYASMIKEHYL